MTVSKVTALFALVLALAASADAREAHERPRIGLALSGGGTKAGAHIGVLRVLEANRVPIDFIAGTSAGAIIGGLYAAGLSPDEIETAVAGIDWNDMLQDAPPRRDLPFRRKRDDLDYLVDYRPGFSDGELKLPMGFVHGQKVTNFFRRHLERVAVTRDFDELPIPLRVVATDLETGEPIIIGEGDLALAIRASMAIPVFFSPVVIDGRRLIDGGPSNNLPIDVVRDMGADIVIAVDITAPLLVGDQLDSVLSIADQMTNMLTQRTVREHIATLSASDILIRPNLEGLTGMDFERTLDAVGPGEAAADDLRPSLAPWSLDDERYRAYRAALDIPETTTEHVIQFIEVRNQSSISTETIRNHLGFAIGDPIDRNRIERGIAYVYGLDLFERIDYRIVHRGPDVGILIDIVPKPWGPSYLQFGLRLSEDFSSGSDFNVGIAYLRTEANSLGGEWRAQVDLGERQGLSVNWFQPISRRSRYFVEAEGFVQRRFFRLYDEASALADLRVSGWGIGASAGKEIGASGEFRLGWNHFNGETDTTVGEIDILDDRVDLGEWFTTLLYDRLDDINFPRSGISASVGAFWSRGSAGADTNFEQVTGSLLAARSWGDYSLVSSVEGGTTLDDDAPLQSQFLLGGLGRLSGHPANRFIGQHYALANVTAYRRLRPSLWLPTYAGISLELGNVWNDRDDISANSALVAGAVYAGADTLLGPLYLAWGLAEGGEDTVYLYLGNPFVRQGARPLD